MKAVKQYRKWKWLGIVAVPCLFLFFFIFFFGGVLDDVGSTSGEEIGFTGEYTEELPEFPEITGTGNIPDEVAQFAVGTAVKYRLLPSVVMSQWAYESAWGTSQPAKEDNNFFGITWFAGCPFPKGSVRGVNGSEGGWYMKFPSVKASFSYYGYMLASQSNFNAVVGNKDPRDCLLILGRGGYAAAGITESSPYFTSCMSIIEANHLTNYDEFAIKKWQTLAPSLPTGQATGSQGLKELEKLLGQRVGNGQCYGLTAQYSGVLNGCGLGAGTRYTLSHVIGNTESASDIGIAYDWSAVGWKVIKNPSYDQLVVGAIINWSRGGQVGSWSADPTYGHTGIIRGLQGGRIQTYEQNTELGMVCAKLDREFYHSGAISSIVIPPK